MKLTEEDIQELYKFTRKHFVIHYDLQTELVDHLANGIERQWEEFPERSFKDARLREFRKFGVHGFEGVISKRKKAMAKRYRKIILRFFKEYFKFPKIAIVFSLILILNVILNNLNPEWKFETIIGFFYLLVVGIFVIYFHRRRNSELEQVAYGKKWMLKDQIYSYYELANILNFIPLMLNFPFFRKYIPLNSILIDLLFSILLVSLAVLSYVILFIIPKKAEELLAEAYPEYKLV